MIEYFKELNCKIEIKGNINAPNASIGEGMQKKGELMIKGNLIAKEVGKKMNEGMIVSEKNIIVSEEIGTETNGNIIAIKDIKAKHVGKKMINGEISSLNMEVSQTLGSEIVGGKIIVELIIVKSLAEGMTGGKIYAKKIKVTGLAGDSFDVTNTSGEIIIDENDGLTNNTGVSITTKSASCHATVKVGNVNNLPIA